MNLVNATPFLTEYTVSTDKTGREWLVIVAKGTYGIPDDSAQPPQLLREQVPLVMADVFTAESSVSAPRYEIDFAPHKPRCDVLLNGSCYAPGGKPATSVRVGMRVGTLAKSFNVVGNRVWRSNTLYTSVSSPALFTVMPVSYNNAFGGVDQPSENPETHRWYRSNPSGVGYHPRTTAHAIDGKPLPNTEEVGRPVSKPDGAYEPMAFGPVGRPWLPRLKWAGTYDEDWLENRAPFLPQDFDNRYFQCAPEDQQTEYLRGGEEVVLVNLTPEGTTRFRLPSMGARFEVFHKNEEWTKLRGAIDTLILEPDLNRLILVARASFALRRSLHEIRCVVAGDMPWEWYREQVLRRGPRGKRRFRSLADLAAWNHKARTPR